MRDTSRTWAGLSGEWAELDEARVRTTARFEELQPLGEGGMGEVIEAWDPVLRRPVALKRVRANDAGNRRRLQREARIAARLDHPNVVPVFEAGVDETGDPWFVMRVVRGRTLAAALLECTDLQGRLALVPHLIDAGRAVAHAHQLGIVHRDVKPANILLDAYGHALMTDWGLARPTVDAEEAWSAVVSQMHVTTLGTVIGTPRYMSPSAAAAEPPDPRDDVWSFGVCLWEICAGEHAYLGSDGAEVLERVLGDGLPPLGREVPAPLREIVERATGPLSARYADAGELVEALEQVDPPRSRTGLVSATWRSVGLFAALAAVVLGGVALVAWLRVPEPTNADARQLALIAAQLRAHGNRADAEVLAAYALTRGESPVARGILLARGGRPVRMSSIPAPACESSRLTRDGRSVVCLAGGELSVLGLDGVERWRVGVPFVSFVVLPGSIVGMEPGRVLGRIALSDGRTLPLPTLPERVEEPHSYQPQPDMLFVEGQRIDLRSGEIYDFAGQRVRLDQAAASAGGEVWWLSDGRVYGDLPSARQGTLAQGRRAPWLAIHPDGSALWLLSANGNLVRYDHDEGSVRPVSLPSGLPRDVSASDRVVSAIDGRGTAWLWPAEHPGARQSVPGEWREVSVVGDTVTLLGERVERWRPGTDGAVLIEAGVSALHWEAGWLAMSHGDGGVVGIREDGTIRAHLSDINVAKDVAVLDGVLYGLALQGGVFRIDGEAVQVIGTAGRRLVAVDGGLLLAPMAGGPRRLSAAGEEQPFRGLVEAVLIDMEPDGQGGAVLLDTDGGVHRSHGDHLERLAHVPGARAVAAQGEDVLVGVGQGVRRLGSEGWTAELPSAVVDLAVNPEGLVAAGLADGRLALIDAEGALRALVPAHGARVSAVAFETQGEGLVSGSWDATIQTWDLGGLNTDPARLLDAVELSWGVELERVLAAHGLGPA